MAYKRRQPNPPVIVTDCKNSPYIGLTWPVKGSRGDDYKVEMTEWGFRCNCTGFQVRKYCKHQKQIDDLLQTDEFDDVKYQIPMEN